MEMKEDKQTVPDLNDFPNEILALIFQHLRFSDRLRMSAVCRRWNELVFAFFGDRIKLHLSASTDHSVPIGKLSNRSYRHVQVFWTEDSSGWMDAVEDLAPKLLSLDLYIMPEERGFLAKWNPPPSLMEQFLRILANLESLATLFINTTPTTFGAVLEAIHDLTNLATLMVEIRIDDGNFALSSFNGLCRLPKLRAVSICSYVPFCAPGKDRLVPAPFVESLTLQQYSPCFSILHFYKLFPCLTKLDVRQVEMDPEELELVIVTWPTLEVLVIGLNSSLLNTTALEMLQQLPKLRKLELQTQVYCTDECIEFDFLQASYYLLETIFQISTLEELRLVHGPAAGIWWSGQIPTDAPSCRLFINDIYVPRTCASPSFESDASKQEILS